MTIASLARMEDEVSQWMTFALDGELYGIDVMQVQEVVRMAPIRPVPGTPSHVLGTIDLRGSPVTVTDARRRLGCAQKTPDRATRIVIVEVDDLVTGMLVDSVAEVVDVREDVIEKPRSNGRSGRSQHVRGVYHHDRQPITLLDLDRLMR
jgi:purine-binding chemotaxis protein CheW